jgi:REP element-mobilizing transposase RayT
MSQSLANLYIHLIFSTKNRAYFLHDNIRDHLHHYIGVTLKERKCPPVIMNSVEDHIHILFNLTRTMPVSKAVEDIKKTSSKWMKKQSEVYETFSWQSGYGAFSVSQSRIDAVGRYIEKQREHHHKKTFKEEYIEFLEENGIEYDERYVWD